MGTILKVLRIVMAVADDIVAAAADGKITIAEALNIIQAICDELDIDFDTTGLDLDIR